MKAWTRLRPSVRGAAMAAGAAVLCWPLTGGAGLLGVMGGTAAGATLGSRAGATRLRTLPGIALGLIVALTGMLLAGAVTRWLWVSQLLGPLPARNLGEIVLWASLGGGVAFAVRLLSERLEALAVLELALVTGAVAVALAAHRGGMVHRPFGLADWAWSRGLDPLHVLLWIGGLTSFVAALFVFRDPRRQRWPVHVLGLLVLALALYVGVRNTKLPEPQVAEDLGITGKPSDDGKDPGNGEGDGGENGERRRREVRSGAAGEPSRPQGSKPGTGQGGQGGQGEDQDLPFRNEYSSSGAQAPVAVVVFHDDYSPPSGVYYFRQSAFSQYNGMRLVQATRDRTDTDVMELFPHVRVNVPGAPAPDATRRELSTTVGLIAEHQKPFALDTPAALWPMANPDPLRFRRAYGSLSRVPVAPYRELLRRRATLPGWTEDDIRHYSTAPDHDPRYRDLALSIRESLPEEHRADPLALAFAVKAWLEENGTYSRRSSHADTADPTASFLFGDRVGYCVHFAHASAFLLRSLGVPARVSAGYAVEESQRKGGSALMIRGMNAHAWPEIPLEGAGWVVVDITPRRSLDEQQDQADSSLQQMLGEALRSGPLDPTQEASTWKWPSWAAIGRVTAVLLALACVLSFLVKLYRDWIPTVASPRTVHRVAYRAALDGLSEIGLRRGRGETREAFARRVAGVSPAFDRLTRLHLAWAHGSRQVPAPDDSRRLARQVRAEARRAVPGWRAVLGALNPLSYLASR